MCQHLKVTDPSQLHSELSDGSHLLVRLPASLDGFRSACLSVLHLQHAFQVYFGILTEVPALISHSVLKEARKRCCAAHHNHEKSAEWNACALHRVLLVLLKPDQACFQPLFPGHGGKFFRADLIAHCRFRVATLWRRGHPLPVSGLILFQVLGLRPMHANGTDGYVPDT